LIHSVSIFHNSLSEDPQYGMPKPSTAPLPTSKSLKELTLEYEVLIINQYIEEYGSLRKAAAALKSSPSVLSSKLTKYYASSSKRKSF
jgi:transcriptional regulator of aromatic amino acid metabolism